MVSFVDVSSIMVMEELDFIIVALKMTSDGDESMASR